MEMTVNYYFQKIVPSIKRLAVRNTVAASRLPSPPNCAVTVSLPLAWPNVTPEGSIRFADTQLCTVEPDILDAAAALSATVIGTALCG